MAVQILPGSHPAAPWPARTDPLLRAHERRAITDRFARQHGLARMSIAAVGALARPIVINPYMTRWLFIAVIGAISTLALALADVSIAGDRVMFSAKLIALVLLAASIYEVIGRISQGLRPAMTKLTDFCLSLAQMLALGAVLAPWISIAVLARFPLRDALLMRVDAVLFGVRWEDLFAWVTAHPWIDALLVQAYTTVALQTVAILAIGSLFRTGDRNGEFLWQFGLTLVATTIVFVFMPALGKVGHGGTGQIDAIEMIRGGRWTTYELTRHDGIINFPSFHTALGVLFAYGARYRWWTAAIFVPLNIVMISATPSVGGHYLIDLPAGAAIAVLAILATRRLRRRWNV